MRAKYQMENGTLYIRAVNLLKGFKYELSTINPKKLFNMQQKF